MRSSYVVEVEFTMNITRDATMIFALVIMFAIFSISNMQSSFYRRRESRMRPSISNRLVLYVFSNTDAEYMNNLKFFVREGMVQDTFTEYVIVINSDEDVVLPELKINNAWYIRHRNKCFDFGTFGYAMNKLDRRKYKYFIFMNSSVRGPFLPAYVRGKVRWEDLFIAKLNKDVKLVGATINCGGAKKEGSNEWRGNPHVQSYLMATDNIGLNLMLNAGVFTCYDKISDTIFHSELGSSKAILDAGYQIDSFMTRYQGVRWSDKRNWNCNRNVNPYGVHMNDGITLEAMEVIFVKVKEHLMEGNPYMQTAVKYDKWYSRADADITKNDFILKKSTFNVPYVLVGLRRGIRCFDCKFYKIMNPDLPREWTCQQEYEHYIYDGSIEGRKARYLCPLIGIPRQAYMPRKGEETQAAMIV